MYILKTVLYDKVVKVKSPVPISVKVLAKPIIVSGRTIILDKRYLGTLSRFHDGLIITIEKEVGTPVSGRVTYIHQLLE